MTALAGALGVGSGVLLALHGRATAALGVAVACGAVAAAHRFRYGPLRLGAGVPASVGLLLGILAVAAAGPLPHLPAGPARAWVEARADGTDIAARLVSLDGAPHAASVRLELPEAVRAGDRLLLAARVEPPDSFDLEYGFAARLSGTVLASEPGNLWWRVSGGVRDAVRRGTTGLPQDQAALLSGLLIGADDDLPAADQDAFEATGLVHLTAVSGANVAIVLGWFFATTRGVRRGVRLAGAVPILALFALVTAVQPSVLRATAVASMALLALWRGRRADPLVAGGVAVAALLVVTPRLLLAAGFQLSLAAAAGVVAIGVPLARRLRGPSALTTALAVTLGAQIGVAPILAWRFGAVSAVGVVANVVAVPLAVLATTTGAVACAVAAAAPAIAAWVHRIDGPFLGMLLGIARAGARLPGASLPTATPGTVGLGACVFAATWLASRLRAQRPVGLAAPMLALTYVVVLRPGLS